MKKRKVVKKQVIIESSITARSIPNNITSIETGHMSLSVNRDHLHTIRLLFDAITTRKPSLLSQLDGTMVTE